MGSQVGMQHNEDNKAKPLYFHRKCLKLISMAGFVRHSHTGNNMHMEEEEAVPYYAYGFYYNPALQNTNEVVTPHHHPYGVFNGFLGVNGNGYSEPVQHQMHYGRPYGANRSNGSGTWAVQVGPNPYYMQRGSRTIQGDVVQRGNFSGRGMGARLFGNFSASGDIN